MQKLILLVFHDDDATAGAASILKQVASYYLVRQDDVYVLFLMPRKYGHWDAMDNPNLHLFYGGGMSKLMGNIMKLRKVSFDYSYSSLVMLTGMVGLLRRLHLLNIKKVVGRESTSIFTRYKGLKLHYYQMWYRMGYRAVDVLICQTEFMKAQLLRHQPWLEEKSRVIVIPNPVNVEQMCKKGAMPLDTEAYQPYIVTAGRFIPEKGYDVLLAAFAEVLKGYPEMHLVFLGDGQLREELKQQVTLLGMEDEVKMVGQVDNVYPWFKQAALCVVSSRLEGFPNVLLQMMSQNDRVVSTLCAGDIDKIKGLVTCEINTSKGLAKAMSKTLEADVSGNRVWFNQELKERNIERFVEKVEQNKK